MSLTPRTSSSSSSITSSSSRITVEVSNGSVVTRVVLDQHTTNKDVPQTVTVPMLWHCSFCVLRQQQQQQQQSQQQQQQNQKQLFFSSKSVFLNHFKRVCHMCDLEFTSTPTSQVHRRIHMCKTAKHICNLCGAKFDLADDFASHRKNDHRAYRCVGCPKTFSSLPTLAKHCKSSCLRSRRRLVEEEKSNVLRCHVCHVSVLNGVMGLYLHYARCEEAIEREARMLDLDRTEVVNNLQLDLSVKAAIDETGDVCQVTLLVEREPKVEKTTPVKGAVVVDNQPVSHVQDVVVAPPIVRDIVVATPPIQVPPPPLILDDIIETEQEPLAAILAHDRVSENDDDDAHHEINPDPSLLDLKLLRVFGSTFVRCFDSLLRYSRQKDQHSHPDNVCYLSKLPTSLKGSFNQPFVLPTAVFAHGDKFYLTRTIRRESREEERLYELYKDKGIVMTEVDPASGLLRFTSSVPELRFLQHPDRNNPFTHFNIFNNMVPYLGDSIRFLFNCRRDDLPSSKPYACHQCVHCGLAFLNEDQCKIHTTSFCHDCQGFFTSVQKMTAHFLEVHRYKVTYSFECPYNCDRSSSSSSSSVFTMAVSLARHVYHRHRDTMVPDHATEVTLPYEPCDDADNNNPSVQCTFSCKRILPTLDGLFHDHSCKKEVLDAKVNYKIRSRFQSPEAVRSWIRGHSPMEDGSMADAFRSVYPCFICLSSPFWHSVEEWQSHMCRKHCVTVTLTGDSEFKFSLLYGEKVVRPLPIPSCQKDYDDITPVVLAKLDGGTKLKRPASEVCEVRRFGVRKVSPWTYCVEADVVYPRMEKHHYFVPVDVRFCRELRSLKCGYCEEAASDAGHFREVFTGNFIGFVCRVRRSEIVAEEAESSRVLEERISEERKRVSEEKKVMMMKAATIQVAVPVNVWDEILNEEEKVVVKKEKEEEDKKVFVIKKEICSPPPKKVPRKMLFKNEIKISPGDRELMSRYNLRPCSVRLTRLENPEDRTTFKIFRAKVPRTFLEDSCKVLPNGLRWGDIGSEAVVTDRPIPNVVNIRDVRDDPICCESGPLVVGTKIGTSRDGWCELGDEEDDDDNGGGGPLGANFDVAGRNGDKIVVDRPMVEYTVDEPMDC